MRPREISDSDLEVLINGSGSIINLEDDLKKEGYSFKTHISFLKFLKKRWEPIAQKRLRETLGEGYAKGFARIKKNCLPTRSTLKDRVNYHIHGIAHGAGVHINHNFKINEEVKFFIQGQVDKISDYGRKGNFLVEQNLIEILSLYLPVKYEIQDHHLMDVRNNKEFKLSFPKFVSLCLLGLAALPIVAPITYYQTHKLKNKLAKEAEGEVSKIFLKALQDLNYQFLSNEAFEASSLPNPVGMERAYISEKIQRNKSTSRLLMRHFKFIPSATSLERALYTSNELVSYAHNNSLADIHYLGGILHVKDIIYLLNHPGYSTEHLDDYLKSKK